MPQNACTLVAWQQSKKNHLSLKKTEEVIEIASKNPGTSVRMLGEHFQCGRTQIATILREKASILALYEANAVGGSFHMRKRSRNSKNADINKALYKWYLLACSKNIYPAWRASTC